MIPIRDTIPSQRKAWVVRLLLVMNLGFFVGELLQGAGVVAFVYRFGVVPSSWAGTTFAELLQWPGRLATLVTSQFLHGSLVHLGSNMLYLWIFGDNVEDRLGHGRFVVLYLSSGAIAALVQLLVQPASSVPLIGASGAIAGVLGAYLLLFPFARITTLVPMFPLWQFVDLPALVFLGLWFLLQWAQGLTTIGQFADVGGGIAWWAHIGGFVSGLIFVRAWRIRRLYF